MTKESFDPFYDAPNSEAGQKINTDVDSTVTLVKHAAGTGGDVNQVLADEIKKEMQKLQSQYLVGAQGYYSQKLYDQLKDIKDDKTNKPLFPNLAISRHSGLTSLLVDDKTNKSVDTTASDVRANPIPIAKSDAKIDTPQKDVSKNTTSHDKNVPPKTEPSSVTKNDALIKNIRGTSIGDFNKQLANNAEKLMGPMYRSLKDNQNSGIATDISAAEKDKPELIRRSELYKMYLCAVLKDLRSTWHSTPDENQDDLKTKLVLLNNEIWNVWQVDDVIIDPKHQSSSANPPRLIECKDITGSDADFNKALNAAYLDYSDSTQSFNKR